MCAAGRLVSAVALTHFATRNSIQLCITVQLPPEFGGLAGEAIYIGALRDATRVAFCASCALTHAHLVS